MEAPFLGDGYAGNCPCGDVGEKAGAEIDGRPERGNPAWAGDGDPGDWGN